MTDQSVFEEQKPNQETPDAKPDSNIFSDQLKNIVNEEGKQKYQNIEKALEGLKNSQEYIPQLQTQLNEKDRLIQELQEKVNQSNTLEDVLTKLTQPTTPTESIQAPAAGLGEDQVLQILAKQEAEKQHQANELRVSQALRASGGENTVETLKAKLSSLGIDMATFQQLSRTSPEAALKLVAEPTQQKNNVTTSSQTSFFGGNKPDEGLKPPEKSLLQGSTTAEQAAYMRQIRDSVYKKHGVVTT